LVLNVGAGYDLGFILIGRKQALGPNHDILIQSDGLVNRRLEVVINAQSGADNHRPLHNTNEAQPAIVEEELFQNPMILVNFGFQLFQTWFHN